MYNFNTRGRRKAGLGFRDGPSDSLLSTFRNPSIGSKAQIANSAKGDSVEVGWLSAEEDEISNPKAPSVSTSPRGARIHCRTPVPETSYDCGMDDHGDFVDIDDFTTPVQTRTRSKAIPRMCEDGDITPTIWKSSKEHDEETLRLLRERNSSRVNPQHVRGAGFNVESVRQIPGVSWDKGPNGKKKSKAIYGRKPTVQSQPKSQTKKQTESLNTDGESEDEDELQSGPSKTSVTHTGNEFRDPTKLYALPPKEDVQLRPFRNPMQAHPLPPRDVGHGLNGSIDTSLLKPLTGFRNPMEKFMMHKKEPEPTIETEKPRATAFINPFARKYEPSPEAEGPESQLHVYYVDDSNDEIASIGRGSDTGGPRKRKAPSAYPRMEAIDLSTPKASYRENMELSSSPNGTERLIEGSQSSPTESQFPSSSSQVWHMDDISLELRETKLRQQGNKRKKLFETADACVLCAAVLPLGTLDAWKDDDGELQPIRMAEWTEICDNHKAADLRKEWEEKGYPVIEWKGLRRRVERHHRFLADIVENKLPSPFRKVFAKQQKEIRGNAALLLRKDHQLQYPGYYGPRGSGIMLHEITVRLASFVGDAGKKDGLIAQGGVAAFIQTVLVPELGVRLIMEDMNVGEAKARVILDESQEIGEKLNMDEFTEDIYDEEDGPWFDINAKTPG